MLEGEVEGGRAKMDTYVTDILHNSPVVQQLPYNVAWVPTPCSSIPTEVLQCFPQIDQVNSRVIP